MLQYTKYGLFNLSMCLPVPESFTFSCGFMLISDIFFFQTIELSLAFLFRAVLLVMESLSFFFFLMWECLNFSLILEGRFTCSIMVAKAVIFITLHYYNAVLLSYSLYCALDLCSLVITHCRLVHLNNISPTPTFHAVPGHHHSALCFYFKFVIFRFHICDIIKYLGFPDVSFKHKVLKVHPWGCKRQDILSHVRIIFHCVYISHIVLNLFILNWKIIPLHYCVDFDQIPTWISHRFTCVCSHYHSS